MWGRTRLLAILGGLAVVALIVGVGVTMHRSQDAPGPSRPLADEAAWPRAAFIRSCIDSCRKGPGMTEDKYPICDRACACAADEAEKTMTYRDLVSAEQAIGGGSASPEQTAKIRQIQAAGMRCAGDAPPAQK